MRTGAIYGIASGAAQTVSVEDYYPASNTLNTLTLSAKTFSSGAGQGNAVGTTSGSTVAITAQSNAGALQIANLGGGVWQFKLARQPDWIKFSHRVITETLTGFTNSPNTTAGIGVIETLGTLNSLTLSNSVFGGAGLAQGTTIANIVGTTAGSTVTITAQSTANAFQLSSPVSNVWPIQIGSGAPTGANALTLSLTETLFGYSNSPNTTAGIAPSNLRLVTRLRGLDWRYSFYCPRPTLYALGN